MKVRVRFWSYLRDLTGCDDCVLELAEPASAQELKAKVFSEFPKLEPVRRSVLMAVGFEYQPAEYQLKEGDEVSFFPPVQGG